MIHFFSKHKLTSQELSLIPEALFCLFLARLKVTFLPSRKWIPGLENQGKKVMQSNSCAAVQSARPQDCRTAGPQDLIIARVINGLSSRTPWKSTCLVKALAAHRMLLKRAIPHSIHFGVNTVGQAGMQAHAWLSAGNEIIIGKEVAGEFKEVGAFFW